MQVLDLVQFDPTRNCFVLKGNMQNYPPKWPDGTRKSTNNAFNWRTDTPSAAPKQPPRNARAKDLNSHGDFHTTTKLNTARIPYGRSGKFKDITAKI
jgi:hypothetical protein